MIAAKICKRLVELFFSFLFLPIWWLEGLFPRDKNLWIFSAWFGEKYSDNSRAFFEYVLKNHPEIKCVWITKNKSIFEQLKSSGCNVVYSKSLQFLFLALRAGKMFTTTGGEFFFGFCNGIEHYALWHGMPLKKILCDDEFTGEKAKKTKIMIFIGNFLQEMNNRLFKWRSVSMTNTYTVTNADFFRPFLKTAFRFPDERILNTGSPRLDALFAAKPEPLIEKLRSQFPKSTIILYMPTFRTGAWTKKPFNPFDEKYGFKFSVFQTELEHQQNVVLYKPHFVDAALLHHKNGTGRFITISDDDYDELYNFVAQVDVLITDYSSIYFDFIATRKPVILAPFDLEEYLHTARGHYFDYNSEMEATKAHDWNELLDILANRTYSPASEEKIIQFAQYVDGHCSERLFSYIHAKERDGLNA